MGGINKFLSVSIGIIAVFIIYLGYIGLFRGGIVRRVKSIIFITAILLGIAFCFAILLGYN